MYWVNVAVRDRLGTGDGQDERERASITCAPRVVFCAAPPAMSFASWFWSRSS